MAEEEPRIIRGAVVRVFHASPNFSAGRLMPAHGDVARPGEISFAGKLFVRVGESVTLRGRWEDSDKWGRQFKVSERILEDGPPTADALTAWLTVNTQAHGVGPMKARRLAQQFGDNFAGWLKDNPEQMAIDSGIPLSTIHALAQSWEDQQGYNTVGLKLAVYELTESQIKTLYEKFKGSIVSLLDENPYLLIGEVSGLGFRKIDGIAIKLGTPRTHPGRIDAAIKFCLGKEEDDGSTCTEQGRLIDAVVEELKDEGAGVIPLVRERLAALGSSGKLKSEEHTERTWIALPRTWKQEHAVAEFLRTASGPNPHFDPDAVDALALTIPDLDDSQRRAFTLALRHRACLISGGAGVGKSFLIAAIAKFYREQGAAVEVVERQEDDWPEFGDDFDEIPAEPTYAKIALAAPTGKAARRLEEITGGGFSASTIHRLLVWRPPHGFYFNDEHQLSSHVVILDESSMIDVSLAYATLSAIGPRTALVLVGDHHQLPPVGPGALLRDAITHELLPMAILSTCHRQAGHLKENCQAILRGEVPPTVDWTGRDGPGPWYVAKNLHTPDALLAYIERLFTDVLTARLGFDFVREVQFLTPIHAGPLGTKAINTLLQRLYQKSLGVDVDPVEGDRRPKFYVGDKVIQTKNNYALDVMNGHQGVVISANPLVIDFDGREVAIPGDCRGDVELSYCVTPHKYQGSEVPCAVVICHKLHRFMLHRNHLYTATTRARTTCIILGDPEGVEIAAKTLKNNQRRTLLPIFAARQGMEFHHGTH